MQDIDQNSSILQGGCSAKFSQNILRALVEKLPTFKSKNLLVGAETSDDSAVWQIDDNTAIIKTVDFFPSVYKDPYIFGQIAAANALSDIYAMGGEAFLALNIVMFPVDGNIKELEEILKGGADKLLEAEVSLAGGHTINDRTPKYGLSVTGKVHPSRIIKNCSAKVGEDLILTKGIGTGTILLGEKFGFVKEQNIQKVLEAMMQLNKSCAEIMQKHDIKCATDITGFGLLGHGLEMAKGSNVSLNLNLSAIPIFKEAYSSIRNGCIPNASFRNLEAIEKEIIFLGDINFESKMLLCDPQTSGGILLTSPKDKTSKIIEDLKKAGYKSTNLIGEIAIKTQANRHITIMAEN